MPRIKTIIFTKEERDAIKKDFDEVSNKKQVTAKELSNALRGTLTCECNKERLHEIMKDIKKNKQEPFIHNNSLTAWCNIAAEKYGLAIKDILKMKKRTNC